MSYTADTQLQGYRNNNDATFLMEGLISEIEAINDYDYSLSLTENKEIIKILFHIKQEEIEHYFSFLEALRKLDNEFSTAAQAIEKQIKITEKINFNEYSGIKENRVLLFTSIRNAIKGELDAIILYNKFLNDVKSNELFKIIKVIIINEKEHVEELTKLLILLGEDSKNETINLC